MSAAFWDLRDRLVPNARARELAQWIALEYPGESLASLLREPVREDPDAPNGPRAPCRVAARPDPRPEAPGPRVNRA